MRKSGHGHITYIPKIEKCRDIAQWRTGNGITSPLSGTQGGVGGVALGYAHLWHGCSCFHTALFASAYPYGLLNKFIPHKNMNLSNSKGIFDILAQKQRCSFAFPLKTGISAFPVIALLLSYNSVQGGIWTHSLHAKRVFVCSLTHGKNLWDNLVAYLS